MSAAHILLFALLAQAAPPAPAAQDKAKAQALLSEGTTLYDKGDYLGALEKFNTAYAAFPSAKIWFNIGQTNRDLGRPVDALDALQKFLDGAPDASPEDRADAQSSVAELQKRLGQLTIVCDMAGAIIRIDGKALGPAPLAKPVWSAPGMHQVTATQKGVAPAVEDVEVSAGASTTVVLRIGQPAVSVVPPPVAATAPPVEIVTAPPPAGTSQGWWLGRKWTWVAAGATVVLAGAAAGVGITVNSRYDELNNSCGSMARIFRVGCDEDDISSLRTRRNVANALWGLAGAAAVTTGVLFFVEGRPVAAGPVVAGQTIGFLARVGF